MATKKKKVAEVPAVNPDEVKELLTREIPTYAGGQHSEKYEGSTCRYTEDGLILVAISYADDKGVVHVKPGTKAIRQLGGTYGKDPKTIILPESVIAIEECAFSQFNATIKCETPHFKFVKGMLYTADMKTLLYAKKAKEVIIPEGVTRIAADAFRRFDKIQSVQLPDSLTSIGDGAFRGCENLENINIPDSVSSIGDSAFNGCEQLQSITIPAAVTNIGNSAFLDCKELQGNIVIPDSVISIGDKAFGNCYKLQGVTIGNSVTSIGDSAFYRCESLQNITIPDSVTNIGNNTFYWCRGLQNVTIPDSVTSIGDGAFSGCQKLQRVTIPATVTCIGDYTFCDCDNLQSITIPDSVISIGDNAFSHCYKLQNVTIPDSIASIGDEAFEGCKNLQSIIIPDNTEFKGNPFYECSTPKVVSNRYELVEGVLYDNQSNRLVNVFVKDIKIFTIPDSITSIGNSAFRDCHELQDITIPNSITSIGNEAFCSCGSLQSITIPDSVTNIGNRTFHECRKLQSATIGNTITSIGDSAFYRCESLQNITIPDSVTSIGKNAFSWCINLQSITIGNSVSKIEDDAFYNCKSLQVVVIHDSNNKMKDLSISFYTCDKLQEIIIPQGSRKKFQEMLNETYWKLLVERDLDKNENIHIKHTTIVKFIGKAFEIVADTENYSATSHVLLDGFKIEADGEDITDKIGEPAEEGNVIEHTADDLWETIDQWSIQWMEDGEYTFKIVTDEFKPELIHLFHSQESDYDDEPENVVAEATQNYFNDGQEHKLCGILLEKILYGDEEINSEDVV